MVFIIRAAKRYTRVHASAFTQNTYIFSLRDLIRIYIHLSVYLLFASSVLVYLYLYTQRYTFLGFASSEFTLRVFVFLYVSFCLDFCSTFVLIYMYVYIYTYSSDEPIVRVFVRVKQIYTVFRFVFLGVTMRTHFFL